MNRRGGDQRSLLAPTLNGKVAVAQFMEVSMGTVILALIVTVGSVIVCHTVAKRRGANPLFWGVMGAVFGPLAIPFVFFAKRQA